MDVVGLGALNVDMIYEVDLASLGLETGRERIGSCEEFKALLELLKNRGKLKVKSGGGSAANTIYALAKMGFSCGYLGKVGKDEEGSFLLEDLNRIGVDTGKVKRNKKSGICLVLLDKSKDRTIIVLPNANDTLAFSELDIDYINKAEFLHMTSFLGKVPFEAQKKIAGETRAKISFNPGEPHATRGLKELSPILEHTFILFLSQKEVEILTGKDYKKGMRTLLSSYGIEIIACTLGGGGSYLLSREEELTPSLLSSPHGEEGKVRGKRKFLYYELEVPPEKVEVVDTTGAGDVYAAGFLAGLLKRLSLSECARLATRAAAQSIKGYGRDSYPKNIL